MAGQVISDITGAVVGIVDDNAVLDPVTGRKVYHLDGTGGGGNAAGAVTAFEVWATDEAISAGSTISGVTYYGGGAAVDFLNGTVPPFAIPAGMTEVFRLRSYQPKSAQNVIVDFGDGTTLRLAELDDSMITVSQKTIDGVQTPYTYTYWVQHTYSEPNKVYRISVYGDTYFSVNASMASSAGDNLVCRIFANDLPIAPHITNLSSLCGYAKKLFKVVIPEYTLINNNLNNLANMFGGASNLKAIVGFGKVSFSPINIQNMFSGCYSLTQCDFRLPAVCNTKGSDQPIKYVFENCRSLAVDVNDLLPLNGFMPCTTQSAAGIFKGCSALTGTVPAEQLWDNPDITWTNTANCFSECSAAIRAQVPVSWGGTAPDSIIKVHPSGTVYVTGGTESNVTFALGGGTHWTFEQPLEGLTVSSVENSHNESEIVFTGGTALNVDIPASVSVVGQPNFEAGKSYIISVRDNILVAGEYTPGVTV